MTPLQKSYRDQGLCTQCGRPKRLERFDLLLCHVCAKAILVRQPLRARRLLKVGKCRCGVDLDPGRRSCAACVERGRQYRRERDYLAEVWP